MNPEIIPNDTENFYKAMESRASELLLVGPARSCKTLTAIRKVFALHFAYPGLQSAILRSNSVDLKDTIRQDIRFLCRYEFDDPRSPIKSEGGIAFDTLHLNGGTCVLGGMNRPGRILGTQKDIILYSQMEQSTNEQLNVLKTRVAGSAAHWRDKKGRVYAQLLGDANPDRKDHHLLKRKAAGKIKFINFEFKDNPIFFRKGKWTSVGKKYVATLDATLEGIYHDRYFKGIWNNAEGAVFEMPGSAITDTFPDLGYCTVYNVMDFGMRDPNVCLWIAENLLNNEITVYREYRKTRENVIAFGQNVKEIRLRNRDRVITTIIDNDENRADLLRRYCHLPVEMARKGPGSVLDGIQMIQQELDKGKLKFYTGLRENRDSELARNNQPLSVIDEMYQYQYQTGADKPIDKNNHGIDALRYYFLWKSARSQPIGFKGDRLIRQELI